MAQPQHTLPLVSPVNRRPAVGQQAGTGSRIGKRAFGMDETFAKTLPWMVA